MEQTSYTRLPFEHWNLAAGPSGLEYLDHPVLDLIRRFDTPFYLFMEDRLRDAIRSARKTVETVFFRGALHYSVKTNGLQRVLDIVHDEGLGAEVISVEEQTKTLAAGFSPGKLIFNGPGKTDEALRQAVRTGLHINVESLGEAEALCRIARQENRRISAGIRINPDVFDSPSSGDMRTAGKACVFGLEPGDPSFRRVLDLFSRSTQVSFHTLSAHIGTGIIDAAPYRLLARQDVYARRRRFPALHEGDAVMICDVGAYNLSAQSDWSFTPAPVVAVSDRDIRRL